MDRLGKFFVSRNQIPDLSAHPREWTSSSATSYKLSAMVGCVPCRCVAFDFISGQFLIGCVVAATSSDMEVIVVVLISGECMPLLISASILFHSYALLFRVTYSWRSARLHHQPPVSLPFRSQGSNFAPRNSTYTSCRTGTPAPAPAPAPAPTSATRCTHSSRSPSDCGKREQ